MTRMRNLGTPLISLAVGIVVAGGCGSGADDGSVLARSTLGEVTASDLDSFVLGLDEGQRRPPEGVDMSEWRRGLLERLLVEEALLAENEAEADAGDDDPNVEAARREVLMAAFEDLFVAPMTTPTDEQLRQYYDEHPEEFGHPEQIRVRHIFKRVARDAPAEERARVRQEIEQLLGRIREGAHFGDLAREHSDSETAPLNGLIGRLSRGGLDPSIEEVVWALDEGEVSEVVPTAVGFHVFLLENHLEPYRMEYEEAGGRILRKVENRAREQVLADLLVELLVESGAIYRPEVLEEEPPPGSDEVLFAVDDTTITMATVHRYVDSSTVYQHRVVPPSQWLEDVSRRALFLWKAEQEGLADTPQVKERLAEVQRQGTVDTRWRRRIAAKLQDLDADGVLEEFHAESATRLQTPKLFHLRIILKEFEGLERPYDVYELLERLGAEIRAGRRDFANTAREVSDDMSARDGGDLGWVHLKYFGEWAGLRVQRAVRALEPGEVSEPLMLEFYDKALLKYRRLGYLLVKLQGVRDPELRPYDEMKEQVAQLYEQTFRRQLEDEIAAEILQSIDAEILEDRL